MAITTRELGVAPKGAPLTNAELDTNFLDLDANKASAFQFLHVRDAKSSGTAGDTFTSGSYQTCVLNTVVTNTVTGASLSSNQITLPAGSYTVNAIFAHTHGSQRGAIYDITNSAYILKGPNNPRGTGAAPSGPFTFLQGTFVLVGTTVIELRLNVAATGSGTACGFGDDEIYSDLMFTKVS